ncbi:MAG: sigma-70 family RNA polymerase sigma factor [Polyangiaceae bacterium]|nr:sigma-70 family RNA polymerase sigma factor [Polyangiaceae bacterium]
MGHEVADAFLPLSDGRLGGRVGEGRARALVDAHLDFVWRVLRRLGVSAADVDDAVQQVFWVAVRKIAPQPTATDEAYLLGIAVRVASDCRRRGRRRRELVGVDPLDSPDPGQSPEEQLEFKRALVLADRILDSMPWELRVAFVLFEIEQKTTPEIAELLGIPLGTAASRLRRSREVFAQAVAQHRAHGGGNP